ncbi:XAC2610-related protein [Flavobacterium psychrotrophum]|uniref:XAC2610-related protein n=1 Tax=Flavobacterium psychrotrophum TaxID=2294119 RepID=UPI000E30B62A|nr:hypothetical protein [Flavobacterium psychrotrophum]
MKIFSLLFISLFSILVHGQDCTYSKISKQYNFKVHIKSVPQKGDADSVFVSVRIFNKGEMLLQKIEFSSNLFLLPLTDCNDYRSYTTGVNKNRKVLDWDYGDIITADFNFDGLEDIAVKREQGGNSGPKYYFYVNTKDGVFKRDKFLSGIGYFPAEFVAIQKKLIFRIRANSNETEIITSQYNAALQKWKVLNKVVK